jgi:glycosyltransferase involved in cell wall biosynthesis
MRVAYYSPMPPSTSGIADYSALLVPALAARIDLRVVDGPGREPGGCDVALYHVGNNPDAHGWIVEALRERPGVVVLHEHVLHHLVAGMTIAVGDRDGYLRAMQRDAGVVGRLLGHGIIDGVVPPVWDTRPGDFPLCGEVLDHAQAVIVHSHTVERAIRERGYCGRVHRVAHPAWPRPIIDPDEALAGIDGPLFGAFGHLNAAKRVPQLLAAFERVVGQLPSARLILAGSEAEGLHLDAAIAAVEERYPGSIVRLPYVDEARLWNLIAACDICVCLRHPTMGETSGIAVRALTCGRPLIVSDVGWFSELPDDLAVRVGVGSDEVAELASAMIGLADDPERRSRMQAAALQYAGETCAVEHVAESYRRALVEAAGGDLVRANVVADVSRALADVGIGADSAEIDRIAARLREAGA